MCKLASKRYPQAILFGLFYGNALHPIRVVASDKVRPLFGPKPEPIPDELDILAVGDDCHIVLEKAGLLEGLFMAMAQDMANAVKASIGRLPKTEWQMLMERFGIHPNAVIELGPPCND